MQLHVPLLRQSDHGLPCERVPTARELVHALLRPERDVGRPRVGVVLSHVLEQVRERRVLGDELVGEEYEYRHFRAARIEAEMTPCAGGAANLTLGPKECLVKKNTLYWSGNALKSLQEEHN